MNRRQFLRTAAALPTLPCLLPTLATERPIADLQPAAPDSYTLQVLVLYEAHWFGLRDRDSSTRLFYGGPVEQLQMLVDLLQSKRLPSHSILDMDITELVGEDGFVEAIFQSSWSNLQVNLKGFWEVKDGLIQPGHTGIFFAGPQRALHGRNFGLEPGEEIRA